MKEPDTDYSILSDKKILEHIVSEKTANQLIAEYSNLEEILLNTYSQELKQIKGIGDKTSRKIKAIGAALKRIMDVKKKEITQINSPEDVYRLLGDMAYLKQEEVRIILLDTKKQVIKVPTVSVGTINSSVITPREVYARAVKAMSAGVIMAHNHPSGKPEPTDDDRKITQKMIKAGRALSISFLDHLIIGRGCYVSIREESDLQW